MKGGFIVCGEREGPTWDEELEEHKRFDTYDEAAKDALLRADEKPGQSFYIFKAVGYAVAPVQSPVAKRIEDSKAGLAAEL